MAALTRDDIVGILKPAEDTVVVQILATGATKEEFAEAYAWMQNDEALMNAGRSLPSGRWPNCHDLASRGRRCAGSGPSGIEQHRPTLNQRIFPTCINRPWRVGALGSSGRTALFLGE
jgi:hypothetical protein